MPQKSNKTVLKNLQKNLETIENLETTFISQKAKLKESAKNYSKTKTLVQTCKDKLEKYTALINKIEKDVSENNSLEREAQQILADRKKKIIKFRDNLAELKENRRSELYGTQFEKTFTKEDIRDYRNQLKRQISEFDLAKATKLNESAEIFIKKLRAYGDILDKAISESPNVKISTDKFENLSQILSEEIDSLTIKFKNLKKEGSSSASIAKWIISWGEWGTMQALSAAVTTIAAYATTKYVIPLIFG